MAVAVAVSIHLASDVIQVILRVNRLATRYEGASGDRS